MKTYAQAAWTSLEAIREKGPVVHNITNYVVMNNTANALLALGASPVMAHAENEAADMVGIASALVLNIGTLSDSWVRAMFLAANRAEEREIPIVLDPVGAGATPYRTATAKDLIAMVPPTIIRGNASEILALVSDASGTKGVDSAHASDSAVEAALALSDVCGSIVCISGETDYIVGPSGMTAVNNGHPLMTRVTGLGCTATALCGAFAAVMPDPETATVCAMAVMGIAGEMGMEKASGPASLQMHFLDALYGMTKSDIQSRIKVRKIQRGV